MSQRNVCDCGVTTTALVTRGDQRLDLADADQTGILECPGCGRQMAGWVSVPAGIDEAAAVAAALRSLAGALAGIGGLVDAALEQLRDVADLVDPPAAVGVPADQERNEQ